MQRKCEYCGSWFTPTRKNNVFCSRRCKDNASKGRRGIKPTQEQIKICIGCGKEFSTTNNRKMYCNKACCDRHRRGKTGLTFTEFNKRRKEKAKEKQNIKDLEKTFYKLAHTIQKECAYCGKFFYCLDYENKKTCSKECSKKYSYKSKDKRIRKEQIVDSDITLKKLFKRDQGKCYICSCDCDFDDWNVAKTGNKYPGDKYPEIEHVIPISRGGMHSWDNVRLACHKCNHDKGDEIVYVVPMSHAQAYSEKRVGNPPKKTIQMTLDGDVIKVWDSTMQIKRELGLNSKRIQDVCRGYGKTAFGYRWEYAQGSGG